MQSAKEIIQKSEIKILSFAVSKMKIFSIFLQNNLHMSKKSSTFAVSNKKKEFTSVNFTYCRLCIIHK